MKEKLIFVVDDDPFINKLVVRKFSADGFKMEAFENGEDCINAIGKNPDLVILDYLFINKLNPHVMNGMEVFDRIRQVRPNLPVIMLSGQEKGEIVLEFARKGIDDYIIKDNNLIENLHNAINNLFARQ